MNQNHNNHNRNHNRNQGDRKLQLVAAIREAFAAEQEQNQQRQLALIGDPSTDFPGRLEHEEHVRHQSIDSSIPALNLRYRVFAAPCMSDIDSHVGIGQADVDAIGYRIVCGDVWAWCVVTVQVQAIDAAGIELQNMIGQAEAVSFTCAGIMDFLRQPCAYTMLKVEALRDLGKKLETHNRQAQEKVMLHLVAAETMGRGVN